MHFNPLDYFSEDPVNCGIITGNVGVDQDGDNLIDIDLEGVTIRLYNDSNQNGYLDGMEGAQIVNIDSDSDGNFDEPGEVMTDVNGFYELIGVQPGHYIIVEQQPVDYINQVEYDGGDDGDQPENDVFNQIPSIVMANEIDSGNDFVERRPLVELIVYSVPGTLNDQYAITATGSTSGPLMFPVNPVISGQSTGQDSAFAAESINVQLTNADNNATLMNYSILYEVKGTFGNKILSGSTEDGSVVLVNNSKDAVFSITIPSEDVFIKIILAKQARLVFMKETIPASQDSDFTFNKLLGGGGIPANFVLDGESVDGADLDININQAEFQISGGDQGIYTIQEVITPGWMVSGISCFNIIGTVDEIIDLNTSSVTIDVQNSDKAICTYTSMKMGAISGMVMNENLGLANVLLALQDTSGSIINTIYSSDGTTDLDGDGSTDPEGYYYFGNLIPGDYNIIESQPSGYEDIMELDGGDDLDKVDNNIMNNIPSTVNPGENDSGNDFIERSVVLPVTLSYFSVKEDRCARIIEWGLENSFNLEKTIIEYSFTGKSWKSLYEMRSENGLRNEFLYKTTMKTPTLFFRLKFVDFDGSLMYSDMINSIINCRAGSANVYPNPVKDLLTVALEDYDADKPTEIMIYNLEGKQYYRNQVPQSFRKHEWQISVSDLPHGIYFLELIRDGYSIGVSKFIKN